MNLAVPSNLFYLCSLIAGPLSLKFIDVQNLTKKLFRLDDLEDDDSYNERFSAFGFDDRVMIIDMQISLYILLSAPILWTLISILGRFPPEKYDT